MNRTLSTLVHVTVVALCAAHSNAQVTLTPVTGFGANGWLAPGSTPYLGTANNERGLAYNPVTGNLVLVSRTGGNNVRILNGATGADLGGLDLTGVSGGTFAVNMTGVADDGSIYVANLAIFNATTNPTPLFKVYRWNDEASGLTTAPLVAYSGTPGAQRIGDSFAVNGGNGVTPLQFAAAGSAILNNANTTIGSNFAIGQLDFNNTAVQYGLIAGTTSAGDANSNDYRLGITWLDNDTVIGNRGTNGRVTTFDPVTQTAVLDSTVPLGGAARRALDYAVIGGVPMLAVIDSNSSNVAVFNVTDPGNPILMASATTTTGTLAGNVNGTGSVAWGAITGTTARLYAMSSNQGIQAFDFSFGPLAATTTYGVGCDGLGLGNTGLPRIGNAGFSLDVTGVSPFTPIAFLAIGTLPVNPGIDLTVIGMPGCSSYTTFDIGLFQTGAVVGTTGSFVLAIPANTALAGASLATQGVSLSIATPLGLNASNGVSFTVGF
jgi:hypothetical protein